MNIDFNSSSRYQNSILLYTTLFSDYTNDKFETKEDIIYVLHELSKNNSADTQKRSVRPAKLRLLLSMYNDSVIDDEEFMVLISEDVDFKNFSYSQRTVMENVIEELLIAQTKYYILSYSNFTSLLVKIFYKIETLSNANTMTGNNIRSSIRYLTDTLMSYVSTNENNIFVSIIGFMLYNKLLIAGKMQEYDKIKEMSKLPCNIEFTNFILDNEIKICIETSDLCYYKAIYNYIDASYDQNEIFMSSKTNRITDFSTVNHCLGRSLIKLNKILLDKILPEDDVLLSFFMDNASIINPCIVPDPLP